MKTSWLKAAPLLALNVVFWLAYAVIVGVLWVIGVPLIWLESRARPATHTQESRVFPGRIIRRWYAQWMNPVWGNEQEGVDGLPLNSPPSVKDWPLRAFKSDAARIIEWSALRNSTNNLRFMHYFVPWLGWINPKTIEPKRIRWCGTDAPLNAVFERHTYRSLAIIGDEVRDEYFKGDYVRRFACLFVSQGVYAGLRVAVRFKGRAHQIWFGWKLNPGMAVEGWWPEDPCWKGVGFTCGQVRHST